MERICLALGARGLVNAQFIVRDDGVYLIEVNPRASRTVPFMSKVTGVPMVELAVRISLGATLAELGWERRPAARSRRSSRSRRRRSRRPSSRASTRRSGRSCSRRARSSGSPSTRAWRWPRRSPGASLIPPRAGDGRGAARAALDRRPRQVGPAGPRAGARRGRATGWRRRPGRARRWRAAGFDGRARSPSWARSPVGDEAGILELIAGGRRAARGQHADAALGRRARRRRHPPRGDRRGRPVPHRDRDRGRGGRGAGPGRSSTGSPRSARSRTGCRRRAGRGRPGLRRSRLADASRAGRDRRARRPCAAGSATIDWPSDHSVSVVSATITTASGISRRRTFGTRPASACAWILRWRMSRGGFVGARAAAMSRCARTWPAQAPSTCPPTTAASCDGPDEPGGQEAGARHEERRAEQVAAAAGAGPRRRRRSAGRRSAGRSGSGRRGSRRRSAAGPRRWRPRLTARPTTSAAPAMTPRNTIRITVFWTSAGLPKTVAKATVCDRPSKMIDAGAEATSATRGISQVASSSPLANGRRTTAVASTASGSSSSGSTPRASAVCAAGTTP